MTETETDTTGAADLARLGEAYFATQHSYDPYNAPLLGIDEFDGLSFDPSREASERAAQQLAAISRQVRALATAGLTGAQRLDHGPLEARTPIAVGVADSISTAAVPAPTA
jgi:hypothetical protein